MNIDIKFPTLDIGGSDQEGGLGLNISSTQCLIIASFLISLCSTYLLFHFAGYNNCKLLVRVGEDSS